MPAGRGTGSVEALLGKQQGELRGEQETAGQWAEGGSAFGERWRGLLHSPWGLEDSEEMKMRRSISCCSKCCCGLHGGITVKVQTNMCQRTLSS